MRTIVIFCLGIICWFFGAIKLHFLDIHEFFANQTIVSQQPVSTGSLILRYLAITPVKNIATLEVVTDHTLVDEYFQDYKLWDFDIPLELDKLISQMSVNGKVKVRAIYGYTATQIGQHTDPVKRWEPQLLYYEIIENNIEQVVAWLGISSNTLVKRVVNIVLQGVHTKLKSEFATNTTYLNQAKQHALDVFK